MKSLKPPKKGEGYVVAYMVPESSRYSHTSSSDVLRPIQQGWAREGVNRFYYKDPADKQSVRSFAEVAWGRCLFHTWAEAKNRKNEMMVEVFARLEKELEDATKASKELSGWKDPTV